MITEINQGQAVSRTHPSPILTATFRGSALQRGRQHGERFGGRVRESGILEFYRDYATRSARGSLIKLEVVEILQTYLATRLSEEATDLVKGFAEGSKLHEADVARALVLPDLIGFTSCAVSRWRRSPTLGCTTVAAWGEATAGGKFLYARNLDFIGNGLYDRAPLVSRHQPDRGFRYVTVGTAGAVVDGVTGINEAGLTVDIHQHLNTHVSRLPDGRPIMDLGRNVLQYASNFDEALRLALSWKPVGAWSLVLTNWKERKACAVERTSKHTALFRGEGETFVYTNTYRDALLKAQEVDLPAFRESSRLRARRAEALLQEARGRVNPGVLAGILSDHVDFDRGLPRGFAQTLAQPHNLTSVVIDPEDEAVWLAEGTAPVCDTPFRRVPLWQEGEAGEVLRRAPDPLTPAQREGVHAYQSALRSWELLRDAGYAVAALETAVEKHPDDPAYRFMHGLLSLAQGDARRAADSFAAGAAMPDLLYRCEAQRLWRARALDVQGKRAEAQALYRQVAGSAMHPALRGAAERGVDSRWKLSEGAVEPDFYHGDAALK